MIGSMQVHKLKTHPEYYQAILDNLKTFEIRSMNDRDFKLNDILILKEWDPQPQLFTGRFIRARIKYLLEFNHVADLYSNEVDLQEMKYESELVAISFEILTVNNGEKE